MLFNEHTVPIIHMPLKFLFVLHTPPQSSNSLGDHISQQICYQAFQSHWKQPDSALPAPPWYSVLQSHILKCRWLLPHAQKRWHETVAVFHMLTDSLARLPHAPNALSCALHGSGQPNQGPNTAGFRPNRPFLPASNQFNGSQTSSTVLQSIQDRFSLVSEILNQFRPFILLSTWFVPVQSGFRSF